MDVLIFGADTGAVAVALAARQTGKTVLCVTSLTYPGEDICAFMNYWDWGKSFENDLEAVHDVAAEQPELVQYCRNRYIHILETMPPAQTSWAPFME